MRSVAVAVVHAPEDAAPPVSSAGLKKRRKADERAPSTRDELAASCAVKFRRALDLTCVTESLVAERAGVAQRRASYWATDPHGHPVPLYGVTAHPLVELVVGASLASQAADALAACDRLDGSPEAITTALANLLHAVDTLHAVLARRPL